MKKSFIINALLVIATSVFCQQSIKPITIEILKGSKMDKNMGPNLYNRTSRVDVHVSGNLSHFQMVGNEKLVEFFPILQLSESYFYYNQQFYKCDEADKINYKYKLNSVEVDYSFIELPFTISKKIYMHPAQKTLVQHVYVKNGSSISQKVFFLEKAKFTMGDPFYLNMTVSSNKELLALGCDGFVVRNVLDPEYVAEFYMIAPKITKVFTRDDNVKRQFEVLKKPWGGLLWQIRTSEDFSTFLQSELTVAANSTEELLVMYGAGFNENEAIKGISEVADLQKKNQLALQFEKEIELTGNKLNMINTPDTFFNQVYGISNKLVHQIFDIKRGSIVTPGHGYTEFYMRDSHWQIRGLLAAGKYEDVKTLLEHMLKYQTKEGFFPTNIFLNGEPEYYVGTPDIDSPILVVMNILEYVKWTGDYDFALKNWDKIELTLKYLKTRDENNDGFLEQVGGQDWLDCAHRFGVVNYCQGIYFRMLTQLTDLAQILKKNDEAKEYKAISTKMKANFDKVFWNEKLGFYADFISGTNRTPVVTQDACLAFAFGLATDIKKIQAHLNKLKTTCWGEWGPRLQDFVPESESTCGAPGFYVNGGVWLWTTAFEAYSHFKFGNPEDGIKAIEMIKKYDFGQNPYNQYFLDNNEWHDGLNGLNCEDFYKQSRNFTTGSGSMIWAVVEGLYGLDISMDGTVKWNPHFPKEWKDKQVSINGLRIRNKLIDKQLICK